MKRRLKLTLVVLAGLALAVYFGLGYFLGSVVRAGINQFGPGITQTEVSLAGARISPFSGSGTLTGLYVGNPAGWSRGPALTVGKIHLDIEPFSVLGDHIVINEITIDQPQFVYETRIVSSNIKALLDNIEGPRKHDGAAPDAAKARPVKFVVKKFRLTHGRVSLGVGPAALPLALPDIALDSLGVSQGGVTSGQLASAVMGKVLGGILQASAGAALKSGAGTMTGAVEKTGEGLKHLFGK
jgi:hypothetical protein